MLIGLTKAKVSITNETVNTEMFKTKWIYYFPPCIYIIYTSTNIMFKFPKYNTNYIQIIN